MPLGRAAGGEPWDESSRRGPAWTDELGRHAHFSSFARPGYAGLGYRGLEDGRPADPGTPDLTAQNPPTNTIAAVLNFPRCAERGAPKAVRTPADPFTPWRIGRSGQPVRSQPVYSEGEALPREPVG